MSRIPVRILCVDDEPLLLKLMEVQLASRGYDVFVANNSTSAVCLVKETRPHIVLLDIKMPDRDGIETLKEISKIDPNVGFIMVTAVTYHEIYRESIKLGAFDYVTKPIDFDYLETAILVKYNKLIG
ncbi:MAG: Regulatory protein AtoC [Syntrophus sp. SKADARSKE-3]|nr:Regulatory protein AtoC [Syntrophus sp. SKADARSKE-3]